MKCIVPYPSVETCGADVVSGCVESLSGVQGIDMFVVAVGSARSKEAAISALSGLDHRGHRFGVHTVSEFTSNGISALMLCLRSSIFALGETGSVLFVPPWWHATKDFKSVSGVPDGALSVMHAGWPWSGCSGQLNYVPRECKYDGFVAVRSWHRSSPLVFNINAPQTIASAYFADGGLLHACSDKSIDALNLSNYWGQHDVNSVLVPCSQRPVFEDVLCTNPCYRR